MKYKFKFRKHDAWFWRSRTVVGHGLDKDIDKMVLYFSDGSQEVIGQWSLHDCKLGTDWLLAAKDKTEKETNADIKLKIGE